ncbi:MAG TPA: hypothetical protein VHI51_17940 [Ktedonobacterales bacterium]|jgi:hypothetical protein|nr:hypothetical protein [Ktedonobacterales bacterium]
MSMTMMSDARLCEYRTVDLLTVDGRITAWIRCRTYAPVLDVCMSRDRLAARSW